MRTEQSPGAYTRTAGGSRPPRSESTSATPPGAAGDGGPGAVPAPLLDRRPGPVPGRRGARRRGVRDQAGAGDRDDQRALDAGVPARWVAGDEVYGADPRLAGCLEGRSIGYVLAIAGNRRLPVDAASSPTAAQLAAALPRQAWQVRSAGAGAHGTSAPPRYRGPGPAEEGAAGDRLPLPRLSDQGVTEPPSPPLPPLPPVAAASADVAERAPLLRPPTKMAAAEMARASPPLPPLPPAPPVCRVVRAGSSSMVWSSNMIPPECPWKWCREGMSLEMV